MSEGFPHAGGDDREGTDTALLYTAMTQATADIGAVRVDPARLRRAQRRHRLTEGGVVAGVLSAALVAATIALHGGGGTGKAPAVTRPETTSQSSTTASPPAQSDSVLPTGISVYDSDNGTEGESTVNQLLAGNGTWTTSQYCQNYATFEGLHKSTGLIFDLGAPTSITSATVSIGFPGADVQMWAADSSDQSPPAVRPGQPPAGFTKVAGATDAAVTTTLSPAQPVTTRYVLVWFTGNLPALPNADPTIHCAHSDGHLYGDSITGVRFGRG